MINLKNSPEIEARILFKDYISPEHEASSYKKIPIAYRNHSVVKSLEKIGAKVRYRGPRPRLKSFNWWIRHLGKSNCLKEDATHFSIYM